MLNTTLTFKGSLHLRFLWFLLYHLRLPWLIEIPDSTNPCPCYHLCKAIVHQSKPIHRCSGRLRQSYPWRWHPLGIRFEMVTDVYDLVKCGIQIIVDDDAVEVVSEITAHIARLFYQFVQLVFLKIIKILIWDKYERFSFPKMH